MTALLRALLLGVLLLTAPAAAQGVPPEWGAVSTRAEALISQDRASDEALARLREELVDWRARFAEAETTNEGRIASLRASLDALGAPPETGEEAPEVAARRADLQSQLDAVELPVREASAAFAAADGLIAELDALASARRSEALLRRVPSPLLPQVWPPFLEAASAWAAGLGAELAAPFATPEARDVWLADGVRVGALVFVAVVLLWRSGTWLGRLRARIARLEAQSPSARLGVLGLSLARMALRLLGLAAVGRLLLLIGATGPRVDAVAAVLPWMGLAVLGARLLGQAAFPSSSEAPTLLPLEPERRREGRWHAAALGILFAAGALLTAMAEASPGVEASRDLAIFVLVAVMGVVLWRLGRLLLSSARATAVAEAAPADEAPATPSTRTQLTGLVGRGLMAVGLAGPALAAAGYVNLAQALVGPAALSLALLAAVSILQGAIHDAYAFLRRDPDAGQAGLAPTLIGIALAIASVPVFAVIWGVRPATLGEWWQVFLRGLAVGETRIAPGDFVTFAVVFGIGWTLVRLLKNVLRTSVLPKTNLDSGGTNAIITGAGYVGVTIAALLAITTAGIDLSGLAIVAGALSVGVGFGLQTIVQNFVSGIILLIERPIKIGDWINAGGTEGFVREISVRSTRIETFDRQDVIVPNADLIAGTVTNYTLGNSSGRVVLRVGVAYGTDTRRVQRLLEEIAESHPLVVLNPAPVVTFDGFGADSLDFTVRVVLRDILFKVTVASELNHLIAERFAAESIEIPFAQRDVWLRNPEALHPPETP